MKLSSEIIRNLANKYGDSFYILDCEQFKKNFFELQTSFRDIYSNTYISYSYKTNYIPKICSLINEFGGYAEVVSDMEYKLALKIGVSPEKIIFNGPYKDLNSVEQLLIDGGMINIDSEYEFKYILNIAKKHPKKSLNLAIRCNFDIGDSVLSRFGFDANSSSFNEVINTLNNIENINLKGLHCHFATRYLENWSIRVDNMLSLIKKYFSKPPEYISLGGGLFGKMEDSLKSQFESKIPTYCEYAEIIANKFAESFCSLDLSEQPKLFIEPGSALAGDSMKFVSKVINIKNIRGKNIATLLGSIYNINPTLNKKNPPIEIYHFDTKATQKKYSNLDFGGYTCIESDYLYRNFSGNLCVGDYVVFSNVGSYSIVLKPPFILPNFPIIGYNNDITNVEIVKRKEEFDDIFNTYMF